MRRRRISATYAHATPITAVDRDYSVDDVAVTALGTSFRFHLGDRQAAVTTPLIGEYQARNTAMAIATVSALGERYVPPLEEATLALGNVFLPGRFQRRDRFIFDVAHNPDGARTIADNITALDPPHAHTMTPTGTCSVSRKVFAKKCGSAAHRAAAF